MAPFSFSSASSLTDVARRVLTRGSNSRHAVSALSVSSHVVLLSVPSLATGCMLIVGSPGALAGQGVRELLDGKPMDLSLAGSMAAAEAFRQRLSNGSSRTHGAPRSAAVDAVFAIRLEQAGPSADLAGGQSDTSDEDYNPDESDLDESDCTSCVSESEP